MQPPVPPSKRSERRGAPTTVPDAPVPPQWRAPGQGSTGPGQAPGTRPNHTVRNVALGCLALLILPGIISALIRGFGGPSNSATQTAVETRPAGASDQVIVGLAVAALRVCAQAPVLNPSNCPQSLAGPNNAIGVVWTVYGDPSAGARVVYQGSGQFYAFGHSVMTAAFVEGSQQSLQVVSVPFRATVQWQSQKGRVTAITGDDVPDGPLVIPRAPALSDQAALDATRAVFQQCAQTTSTSWAALCQVGLPYIPSDLSTCHWNLASDPRLTARVAYDAQYGVVHVLGPWTVTVTCGPDNYTQNGSGNYDSTVGINSSGQAAVLLIKGA
jgi:hypothetical protein